MGVRPSSFVNPLLWCNKICLPMYKGHYTTTQNIVLFANLACVENTLTNFTCNIKNICTDCKKYLK